MLIMDDCAVPAPSIECKCIIIVSSGVSWFLWPPIGTLLFLTLHLSLPCLYGDHFVHLLTQVVDLLLDFRSTLTSRARPQWTPLMMARPRPLLTQKTETTDLNSKYKTAKYKKNWLTVWTNTFDQNRNAKWIRSLSKLSKNHTPVNAILETHYLSCQTRRNKSRWYFDFISKSRKAVLTLTRLIVTLK